MTEIYFRIIILPQLDKEPDLNSLCECVERCNLIVHSIECVQLDKTKKHIYPEILECLVDVRAEDQNIISNKKKVHIYNNLALQWCQVTRCIDNERPMLQFFNNECFFRKRVAHHANLKIYNLSFGVQPRFGQFISYCTLAKNSTVNFYHDVKELEIIESVLILNKERTIVISYQQIRCIFTSLDTNKFDLYLDLHNTPLFYHKHIHGATVELTHVLPFGVDKQIAGKSHLVCLHFLSIDKCFELLSCLRYRCGKIPVYFVEMNVINKQPPVMPISNFKHFGCSYMWKAVTERTFLIHEQTLDIKRSLEKLSKFSQECGDCLEKVLIKLLFLMDSGRLLNYWNVIDLLYHSLMANHESESFEDYILPAKCRLIRRVTFTPTRILLWPPDLICENRILRNFESDYFIRVTFRDEDLSTLNAGKYHEEVFNEVITKHMNSGLGIGNRNYQMLAWSSSQLKDHGVSMYALDSKGRTAADIRRWTEIDPQTTMNIPKCLARIGQCFSQTEDTLHIPMDGTHILFEKDIKNGLNKIGQPYTFSDGVGKISTSLALKVQETFQSGKYCSAFQIRYGGCKGMLVINPTLTDSDIVFRESMRKFDCRGPGHTKLEIAKKSSPITMRLNRPFIAILNDLGIEDRIFLKLQENMLQNLTDILLDESKAAKYLNSRILFSEINFQELSKSGIDVTTEPFFRSLLLALHRYSIDIIKTKANVDLDPNYARNMFGVLDETGMLEYGQVFVQYSSDASLGITTPEDTKIIEGTVLVTKFPCIHPGDVRKFTAIDVPELHHIIDCIVFPQKGPRPHPDEMAGSDLDGDEYAVIWMPELIFPKENAEPGDYIKPNVEKHKNVKDFLSESRNEEIVEFIVDYIKNDQIGRISHAHLAHADELDIFSPICLSLAKKHALAVDFAKTGYVERLSNAETPRVYPDFMERFEEKKRKSKKSLGRMYRVSRDFEMESAAILFQYQNIEIDQSLIVEGWEKFEASSIIARDKYNSRLKRMLQIYGIQHEAEAYGGAFLKFNLQFKQRRDRAEIVDLVHTWLKELIAKTRENFFGDSSLPLNVHEIKKYLECKASAWYIVTYREKDTEFLSFPWAVAEILSNIRLQNPRIVKSEEAHRIPLIQKFENLIIKQVEDRMVPILNDDAKYFLNQLHFHCDRIIVERAVCILTKWGEDEKIITMTRTVKKCLFYKTFLKIIFCVAENQGYISKEICACNGTKSKNLTTSGLLISFFKYCMKLRFLSKLEVKNIIAFDVYNSSILAKRAIVTFHSIAINGIFPTLFYQENLKYPPEILDMKPIWLQNWIFEKSPIRESFLRLAESVLLENSEVDQIHLRENCQKKKVIVSASGTSQALQRLKSLLRMKPSQLQSFLKRAVELNSI